MGTDLLVPLAGYVHVDPKPGSLVLTAEYSHSVSSP